MNYQCRTALLAYRLEQQRTSWIGLITRPEALPGATTDEKRHGPGFIPRPVRIPAASTSEPVCAEGSRRRRAACTGSVCGTATREVVPARTRTRCMLPD